MSIKNELSENGTIKLLTAGSKDRRA